MSKSEEHKIAEKHLNPNLRGMLFFITMTVPIFTGYILALANYSEENHLALTGATYASSGNIALVSVLSFLWILLLTVLFGNKVFVADEKLAFS